MTRFIATLILAAVPGVSSPAWQDVEFQSPQLNFGAPYRFGR